MPSLPQRRTLVDQLVAILRQEITRGAWRDWLPGERQLSSTLQVSRNTLRVALRKLRREGVIHSLQGSGNRISPLPAGKIPLAGHHIAILSPDPVERLRPNIALWIEHFRRLCAKAGYQLHVVHGRQYFRANPGTALQKLLRQQQHACWVLTLSTEATQRWFAASGVPCIVAGSVYEGLKFSYCAQDHRTACAHAARLLLRLGHRRIAILLRRSRLAADLYSELGFTEGAERARLRGVQALVCHHDDTVEGISQQVRRLMRQPEPPTALLVTNANYYLTVSGCLQQMGRQIPRDISLISRNDDPFLAFVTPKPARYVFEPRTMALGLLRLVQRLLKTGQTPKISVSIVPRFIHGDSLRKIS